MATKKTAASAETPATVAAETDATAGSGPGKGKKECPKCQTIMGARKLKCEECGYVFPVEENIAKRKAAKGKPKKTTPKKASRIGAGSESWGDAVNTKVQAAVKYIEQVGSVEEAQRVLKLVEDLEAKA